MANRLYLLVLVFTLSGCLQTLHRYRLSLPEGTRDERTATLARAFVAAEVQPEIVDAHLGMVATEWQAPYGSNQGSQWMRRWVAVIADSGAITLRAEVKVCQAFEGCHELNQQGGQGDVDALEAFAQRISEALNTPVSIISSQKG